MNTEKFGPELVELLSLMTGHKLRQKDITPPVLFMANLVVILIGVIYADGTVAEAEKARMEITINKFIPSKGNVRELTNLMIQQVLKQELYFKINAILTLTEPLSNPQRLLLIGFGYEMSASDGDIDLKEKKYLEIISSKLGIKAEHLQVLEAGFTHQENLDQKAVEEVKYLLNPGRFHELDNTFVKAASEMLNTLFPNQNKKALPQQIVVYEGLKEFKQNRQQLDNICQEVYQIVAASSERNLLTNTLISEVDKISKKLKSQKFRVAVVGEFSQGKSTLLNALLGEEIQPVREIPCSGTVTVLKYGEQKRVVCRYKDAKEVEIPLTEYQEKAAISEEAALGNMSEELAQSELEEIFFEHPDLELCKSGVEIIDSPGLNEHPDRTAITQKLLKNTDAVIFLTNASRPLTQGERELIQSIKLQLNHNQIDLPADNLFVLVNFIDLVRSEKGRQQIKQRLENFVLGEKPIIADESRLHFISAQAALDAILEGESNEYLTDFQNFTKSIEKFLTVERGVIEIQQFVNKINSLISEGIKGLEQAEKVLDGRINLSEEAKQEILEKIGEASGRDVKINLLADKLLDGLIDEVYESWNSWLEELEERLASKIENWSSEHSAIFSRDKLVNDYIDQFRENLAEELDSWINNQLKENILQVNIERLDCMIYEEIKAIKSEFSEVNQLLNSQSNIDDNFYDIDFVFDKEAQLFDNINFAGLGAAVLLPLIFFSNPILVVIGYIASAVAGWNIGSNIGNILSIDEKIKEKVFESGCENFVNSIDKIIDGIETIIMSTFSEKLDYTDQIIKTVILYYGNLLEQQEKAHQETQEQIKSEKAFISEKQQQLTQLQKQLQIILSQINESR